MLGQISLGQISEPLPKRPRIFPPTNERIMIYVKQETEDAFTALHVKPPTAQGLIGKGNYKFKMSPLDGIDFKVS